MTYTELSKYLESYPEIKWEYQPETTVFTFSGLEVDLEKAVSKSTATLTLRDVAGMKPDQIIPAITSSIHDSQKQKVSDVFAALTATKP